ncbi:MAG: accessory gene regulator B family protein [Lachnospiraceae bacterium]
MMRALLKKQYHFSDYQIGQLEYLFKTIFSEISKLVIFAVIFRRELGLYCFAVSIMCILRSVTGGLHCKTYITCLLSSFIYLYLCIALLPQFYINKLFQLIILFFCMIAVYLVGPVTSVYRLPLPQKTVQKVRASSFLLIFFYLIAVYILPESPYMAAGFWVVVLHTLQLAAAKQKKKGVVT